MKSPILSCAIILTLSLGALNGIYADSATWNLNPTSGDWNTANNWTPATVPNGRDDVASFSTSAITSIAIAEDVRVDSMVFNPGASAFTIMMGGNSGISGQRSLTFKGQGIINNSGVTQNFINLASSVYPGGLIFEDSATAGDGNVIYNNGPDAFFEDSGQTNFYETSAAGTSTFINNGTDQEIAGPRTQFYHHSSADHAVIINNPGGFVGGETDFYQNSTAASCNITINGGATIGDGYTSTRFSGYATAADSTITITGSVKNTSGFAFLAFYGDSTAGNAVLIAEGAPSDGYGGNIEFWNNSSGGNARIELFGNGNLDISEHNAGVLGIGSLEGYGRVFLATNTLSVGGNGLNTVFSGAISGYGSLIKIGTGRLIMRGANTYSGNIGPGQGTTIRQGALVADNTRGSATGSGSVVVQSGTLAGSGIIAGPVQIGDASGRGALLSPGSGRNAFTFLTIQSALSLISDATLRILLNSDSGDAAGVIANGVTISGAQFSIIDEGNGVLPSGTTLTAINNTAVTPILGVFSNLSDGGTITVGRNTFQASYEGGDGNDLTLIVVP